MRRHRKDVMEVNMVWGCANWLGVLGGSVVVVIIMK